MERWSKLLLLLLIFTTTATLQSPSPERTLQRLVGGHLRLFPVTASDDDVGLLQVASAGEGNRAGTKSKHKDDEEEKKTLSQQVADGKYGLIQKEIFPGGSLQPPGVVSYKPNNEVPRDNQNTMGGLRPDEIWLSEDHLLVVKGGSYPEQDYTAAWPPIDNYEAPRRPVKIPSNPKVPPPFPVQLTEGGPIQLLDTNSSRTLNGSAAFSGPSAEGAPFGSAPYPNPANVAARPTPFAIAPPSGDGTPPFPFPPLNGPVPPYFASLPPGAMFLPPPSNQTDLYDEDDPSIYYPPPYSFVYAKDNSTEVPPGPLVPGIILPPPPDFFEPLEKVKPTTSTTTSTTTTTTTTTTWRPPMRPTPTSFPKQIRPTTTPVPPTSQIIYPEVVSINDNVIGGGVTSSPPPHVILVTNPPKTINKTVVKLLPVRPLNAVYVVPKKKPATTTVLKAVVSSTPAPIYYNYYDQKNEVAQKTKPVQQFAVYEAPPTNKGDIVSTTAVPLKAYFSTPVEIDTNSVTPAPNKPYFKPKPKPQAEFYFYEEEPQVNSVTTEKPATYEIENQYYDTRSQGIGYNEVRSIKALPEVYYVTARPLRYYKTQRPVVTQYLQETIPGQNTFQTHIDRLREHIRSFYTTPRPQSIRYNTAAPAHHHSPRPVYQYSFEAANYQKQHDALQQRLQPQLQQPIVPEEQFQPIQRYNVQIQESISTELPPMYGQEEKIVYKQKIPVYDQKVPVYEQNIPVYNQNRPIYKQNRPAYEQKVPAYYQEPAYNPDQQVQYVTPAPYIASQTTPNPNYSPVFGQKVDVTPSPAPPRINKVIQPVTYKPPLAVVVPRPRPRPVTAEPHPFAPAPTGDLSDDIAVNYRHPRPPLNPHAEYVDTRAEGRPGGAFISYRLPGNGAHFYFLTPQLAQPQQQQQTYQQPQQHHQPQSPIGYMIKRKRK